MNQETLPARTKLTVRPQGFNIPLGSLDIHRQVKLRARAIRPLLLLSRISVQLKALLFDCNLAVIALEGFRRDSNVDERAHWPPSDDPCGRATCGGPGADPCLWDGIQCESYRVTAL